MKVSIAQILYIQWLVKNELEKMLVYVRALYNNCFIIPTSAQY
jgi:hypothetical protein